MLKIQFLLFTVHADIEIPQFLQNPAPLLKFLGGWDDGRIPACIGG